MINGKPEFKKDGDVLMSIYRKIDMDGLTREPLTAKEMVLLFAISRWMSAKGEKDADND